jgi:hypothetical protein
MFITEQKVKILSWDELKQIYPIEHTALGEPYIYANGHPYWKIMNQDAGGIYTVTEENEEESVIFSMHGFCFSPEMCEEIKDE